MINKNDFDIEKFKKAFGLNAPEDRFDFEKLRVLNPGLTKPIFNFLSHNGGLWKVFCGKEVKMKFSNEYMPPLWFLDCDGCRAKFYTPPPEYLENNKMD
jgi:hypothetical protein